MEKLEKACNISFNKGSLAKTDEGVEVIQVKDDFAALQNIRAPQSTGSRLGTNSSPKWSSSEPFKLFSPSVVQKCDGLRSLLAFWS